MKFLAREQRDLLDIDIFVSLYGQFSKAMGFDIGLGRCTRTDRHRPHMHAGFEKLCDGGLEITPELAESFLDA